MSDIEIQNPYLLPNDIDEDGYNHEYYYYKHIDESSRKLMDVLKCNIDELIAMKELCAKELVKLKDIKIPKIMVNLEKIECDVEEIPEIVGLKEIVCHNSKIKNIPSSLVNLVKLDVSNCRSLKVIPDTFTNLEYLNCSNTSIKVIPKVFTKLKHLICESTMVKKISSKFINLETLNCSDSYVDFIPDTLVNIKYLDISKTEVCYVPEEFKNIEYIDCRYSSVEEVPYDSLKTLFCNIHMYVPKLFYCEPRHVLRCVDEDTNNEYRKYESQTFEQYINDKLSCMYVLIQNCNKDIKDRNLIIKNIKALEELVKIE